METTINGGAVTIPSGAEGGEASGTNPDAPATAAPASPTPTDTSSKTVNYQDHKRAVDDMMRFKREKAEVEAKLHAYQEAQLKKEANYKELYERAEARRQEAEGREEAFKEGYVSSQKWDAVEKELLRSGVRPDAITMLKNMDLKGVETEFTSQGRVIVHGAEHYVESTKKSYPFMFQSSSAPVINPGSGPSAMSGPVTVDDVLKAERESKLDPSKKAHYLQLHKSYMEQRTRTK